MALWSSVGYRQCLEAARFDPEYYRPDYMRFAAAVAAGDDLGQLAQIAHPAEIPRLYAGEGLQILLAQNIRAGYLDFPTTVFMPRCVEPRLRRNRLRPGDLVMTRSGANFGDTALYIGEPTALYACADCLIIRPAALPGGYLSAFLNSQCGRALLTRGAYGMAQPHIAPNYLKTMRVPRLPADAEQQVDDTIKRAYRIHHQSTTQYSDAESLLLRELRLDTLDFSHPLTYVANFSDTRAAGRVDAEYFQPRLRSALKLLSGQGTTIADFASLAKRRFRAMPGTTFSYIAIGDILPGGQANAHKLRAEDAPSRATWVVQPGDAITSLVRPIRRLTAIISPQQSGYVCSSGLAVLTPQSVPSELLLVYLRLPVIAELLDLHCAASMYPAISTGDLMALPFPRPTDSAATSIATRARQAHTAEAESRSLFHQAIETVEEFILGGSRDAGSP